MTEPIQDEQGIHIPNAIWPDVNALPEWAMLIKHLDEVAASRDRIALTKLNFAKYRNMSNSL